MAKIKASLRRLGVWLAALPRFCEHCGAWRGVRLVGAMTQYYWDGKGKDPNRPMYLCPCCEEEYVAYWKEMWSDYYAMIYEGIYG